MPGPFDLSGRLTFDFSQAGQIPAVVERVAQQASGKRANVKVGVDLPHAQAQLKSLDAVIKRYLLDQKKGRVKIEGTLDTTMADRALANLKDRIAKTKADLAVMAETGVSPYAKVKTATAAAATTRTAVAPVPVGGTSGMQMAMMGTMMFGGLTAGIALQRTVGAAETRKKYESIAERTYGEVEAEKFKVAAGKVRQETGYLQQDYLQTVLLMRTLRDNYGLTEDQIRKMVDVSADFAATSPYEDIKTMAQAGERLQSAIRGEAEASERLGLTLNDTYMKNLAFNGSLRDTWEKLSDLEKAQYRYKEILSQSASIQGAASDDTDKYGRQARMAMAQLADAAADLGAKIIPVATKILEFVNAMPDWAVKGGVTAGIAGGLAMTTLIPLAMIGGLKGLRGAGGGLLRGGAKSVAADAATEVAAEAVMEGTGRSMVRGLKKVLTSEVTQESVGASLKHLKGVGPAVKEAISGMGGLSGAIGKLSTTSVGTLGPLALLTAAVAGLAMYLKSIAADTEEATKEREAADERTQLLELEIIQKKTGRDMGVIRDENGVRWKSAGEKSSQVFSGWRSDINGIYAVNAQGQRLSQQASEWQKEGFGPDAAATRAEYNRRVQAGEITVNVKLEDRTANGVKGTQVNAASYDASQY